MKKNNKKSVKKIHCLCGLLFMLFLVSSCDSFNRKPPYVVSSPECRLANAFSSYEIAGVNFDFLNTSSKTVRAVEVTLMVFDAKTGKNPFNTSNLIFAKVDKQMLPTQKSSFEISLDEYISEIPNEPYLVDFFSINKVFYTDGSVFKTMPVALF